MDDKDNNEDINDGKKSNIACGGKGQFQKSVKGLGGGANDDTIFSKDTIATEAIDDEDKPVEDIIALFRSGAMWKTSMTTKVSLNWQKHGLCIDVFQEYLLEVGGHQ